MREQVPSKLEFRQKTDRVHKFTSFVFSTASLHSIAQFKLMSLGVLRRTYIIWNLFVQEDNEK